MLKRSFLFLLFLLPSALFAQKWAAEIFAGVSSYQGDLEDRKYTFQNSKFAFGLGASYAFTNHISVRGLFSLTSLHADDKLNKDPLLVKRNLNFSSKIYDLSIVGQYYFMDLTKNKFSPYAFAGLAVFHFNPYTFDTSGSKFYLQPLGTEGQGLSGYPERKPYSLTQFAIPFGAGVKFAVNEMVSIGFEVSLRKTFTDYLDDLSTTYVDQNALLTERGAKAVELSYRGGEIKDGDPVYPSDGTIRGGADYKDWYYFSGISATIKIPSMDRPLFNNSRSGTGCPKKVY